MSHTIDRRVTFKISSSTYVKRLSSSLSRYCCSSSVAAIATPLPTPPLPNVRKDFIKRRYRDGGPSFRHLLVSKDVKYTSFCKHLNEGQHNRLQRLESPKSNKLKKKTLRLNPMMKHSKEYLSVTPAMLLEVIEEQKKTPKGLDKPLTLLDNAMMSKIKLRLRKNLRKKTSM